MCKWMDQNFVAWFLQPLSFMYKPYQFTAISRNYFLHQTVAARVGGDRERWPADGDTWEVHRRGGSTEGSKGTRLDVSGVDASTVWEEPNHRRLRVSVHRVSKLALTMEQLCWFWVAPYLIHSQHFETNEDRTLHDNYVRQSNIK